MPISGSASYKKKDGRLLLKEHNLEWVENGSMQAALSIAISAVKNLQASPASAASASIRVFAAPSIDAEPVAYTFKFTLPNGARQEMDSFVLAMQEAITAKRAAAQRAPTKPSVSEILASEDIEADADLQEAFFKANPELWNIFKEAVMVRKEITREQFWSSRRHLLRAFLVERSQQKGPYNVLATIRPKTVDNKITVNMTREKIRDVFAQHTILRRIYDETVPPLAEDAFWARFFVSRLCKKLRGERILPTDPVDDMLDKYINIEADESRKRARADEDEYIPKVINLEGNEEHNSKRMGNAPDFTMRPSKTAVINSINSISMNMLDSLVPRESHKDNSAQDQDYEQEFYQQEIQLGDLRVDAEDARIILNIRDQRDFFDSSAMKKSDRPLLNTEEVEAWTERAVPPSGLNLSKALGAQEQIEETAALVKSDIKAQVSRQMNLAPERAFEKTVYDQMTMSHSASQEFLQIFWSTFLSGDPAKAKALAKMAESLGNTQARIEAIAKSAPAKERMVREAFKPTSLAVEKALESYRRAVAAASAP